jgi:hypothetical protein
MTLQSLGSFEITGHTLACMVAKGRCTIDDLDHRPPGADTSYNPKNMLRDWISVNATKWQQIQDEHSYVPEPAVEAGPSPCDFLTTNLPF